MKAIIPEQARFFGEVILGLSEGHAFFVAELFQPGVYAECPAVEVGDSIDPREDA